MAKFLEKIKINTLLIFAAFVFMALIFVGVKAEAFLFWNRSDFVEIYPSEAKGGWDDAAKAKGVADVQADEGNDYFNVTNSAVYDGGAEEMIFSDFSSTLDDLNNKTEDEELLEELKGDSGDEDDKDGGDKGGLGDEGESAGEEQEVEEDQGDEEDPITPEASKDAEAEKGTEIETTTEEEPSDPIDEKIDEEETTTEAFFDKLKKVFEKKIASASKDKTFKDVKAKKIIGANLKMSFAIVDEVFEFDREGEEFEEADEENIEQQNKEDISWLRQILSNLSGKKRKPEKFSGNNSDDPLIIQTARASGEIVEMDIDTKIVIWYSVDGENWEKLDAITQSSISNEENGGYFSYDASFLESWKDVKNLQIKLEGIVGGETSFTSFLDSVWLEVEYEDDGKAIPIISSEKENWLKHEHPVFAIKEADEQGESFIEKAVESVTALFADESEKFDVSVMLIDPEGKEIELEKNKDFQVKGKKEVEIEIGSLENSLPGEYEVKISLEDEGVVYDFSESFTWGVLAVNTNKSIYLPDEEVYVQMAVLNEEGHTICDADLEVEVAAPGGEIKKFTTEDDSIEKSDTCGANNVTDEPDYYFRYRTGEEGIHGMKLVNLDSEVEVTDSFEVKKEVDFDVERVGATRINPFESKYRMSFKIKANKDFRGSIVETVPKGFEITEEENEDWEISTTEEDETQKIGWKDVRLKEGEKMELTYEYQAPKISPMLFLLGPLQMISTAEEGFLEELFSQEGENIVFEETRQWQIASDAETAWIAGTGTYTAGAWTSWNNATLSSDNESRAMYSSLGTATGTIDGFNFAISAGSTIQGIQVWIQGRENSPTCNAYFNTRVSWDGGSTWSTTAQRSPDGSDELATTDTDYYEGHATYLWDHATWTVDEINNNFVVEIAGYNDKGGSGKEIEIDVVNVKVWYTELSYISVSGEADGSVGSTVKVAFDGNVQTEEAIIQSASPNTWSITGLTEPISGTTITAWIEGAAESAEATAVTKYSGLGDVSGMILDANVLTIGSDQNQSLTVTNLNQYDCTENENIMHQAESSTLAVEGASCAGATSNSYTDETIDILGSNTLTIGGTETLTTDNAVINGTLSSGGNSTYNVSGDWTNNSSFSASTSTVNFNGSAAQTIGGSASTAFNNLTISNTSAAISGNTNFSAGGNFTINSSAMFTPAAAVVVSGAGTLTGNGTAQVTRTAATASFGGQYSISGKTLANLTVEYTGTGQVLTDLTYGNLTISSNAISTGTNTATVGGTFSIGGSGVFTPSGGTMTFNNGSTISNSGTLTFQGLTTAASATVTANTSFSVAGALSNGSSSVLTPSSDTITMTGGSIANSGTLTFNALAVTGTTTTSASFSIGTGGLGVSGSGNLSPSGGIITMNNGSSISNSATLVFSGLTISGTTTTSASFSIGGALNVSGGNLSPSGGTITMNNGSSIANSGTLAFQALTIADSATVTSSSSFSCVGNFSIGASATFTPGATDVISGTGTLTGNGTARVTRTAATADFGSQYTITNKTLTNLTVDYTGAGQTLTDLTYNNLSINGSLTGTGTATVTGTFSVGGAGSFTPASGTMTMNDGSTISNSNTMTFQGLTTADGATVTANTSFSVAGALTNGTSSVLTPSSGTITMTGGSITNAGTLTFNGLAVTGTTTTSASFSIGTGGLDVSGGDLSPSGGTITMNNGSSIANNSTLAFSGLTIAAGATVTTSASFNVAGTLTNSSTATFNPSGGTITMNNGSSIANSATLVFNNLTVPGTTTTSASFSIGGALDVSGGNLSPSGGTITMNNGSSIANSGTLAFSGLTIADSATVTTSATFSVTGTLNVGSSGNFTLNGGTVTHSGATLTLTGTISGAGRFAYQSATAFPNGGVISSILRFDTLNNDQIVSARTYGGAVEIFNSTASNRTVTLGTDVSQTIDLDSTLNLETTGTGTLDLTGVINGPAVDLEGDLTFTAGGGTKTIISGAGTWNAAGNVNFTNGGYTASTGNTLNMDGSGTLTSNGQTLENLTLSGTITLADATHTLSGNLDMTGGTVAAGASTIAMNGTSKTVTSATETLNNFEVSGGSISNVDNMDVNGTFTVSSGGFTHGAGADVDINIAGDFTLANTTTWTENVDPTAQVTFDGDLDYADNNGTKQSIGNVVIGTSPDTTVLTTDFAANGLTITSADFFYTCQYEVDIGNLGINVSGTLDTSDTGEGNCGTPDGDETLITTAQNFNLNSGATFVQDQSTVQFDDPSGTDTLITDGTFSLYNLVINGGASIIIQVQDPLDVDNDVTITSGALDVVDTENNQITVGGSWSNADEFTARSGLVLFDSGDIGETIDSGGTGSLKDFYDIQFNNSAGGWTIQTNDMTVTHDLDITDIANSADSWTLDTGRVLEVNGTYTITGTETAYTKWTGSTFYINGTSQEIGSKTQAAEVYGTLHIGTDDDIRMWQSSAATYTVDSGASLYSMDHANVDGELYIWGDYHTNGTDYWNYNDDFDGTDISGTPRDCVVKLAASAVVTVDAGETLETVGVSGHVTTVDWISSGGYNIVNYTGSPGGTIDFQYASFDHLKGNKGVDVQSGSVVTSLNYTDFDNLVDSDTTDAYIYVDTTVIGAGTKTITGANFGNTGGANFNVNRSDAENTGYWDFDAHTGLLAGEAYDGKNGVNEADPGMLKWDDSVAGITVDGVIYSDEGTTPYLCLTTGNLTVDVRVNGVGSYTAECTANTGAFSVPAVTIGSASDVVTIFVNEDGVGSIYATTVTRANDTTSGITANLYQNHVIIRHEDGGPMTIDNLDYFDFGNDNDVQFTATNDTTDTLVVNDGHELYIWGSDTFTPGGNVTVDDIEILGTYTATGSEPIIVSGSWVNSGTFTAASSTVTFDATSGAEAINSSGASTATFNDLVLGSGSGTATWNLGSALDVNGNLTIDYGTLSQGTNNITLNGNLAIGAGGNFISGSGTFTFDGASTPVTWSNTATIDDLGAVVIDGTTKTVNLSSSVQATSVSVGVDDVLGLGDSGYVLTLSGSGTAGSRPFIVNNAAGLTEGTNSTVKYTGTSATEIEDETYYHLELSPSAAGSPIFTLGTAVSQTLAASGNLIIGDGVNSVTVTADTYDPTLNVSGNVTILASGILTASGSGTFTVGGSWSNSGTFTHSSATVTFNSTDGGETISDGGSAFNNLLFNGTNGEWLYTDGTSTAPAQTTVQDGVPTFLNAKTGTLSVTGGTFNQDWYLGTHVVDAVQTTTNIDTGDNDITISEAGSNATVWKHNGADWGTAAASQTTGTAASGINPQPNNSGAIRIREFSMTNSATCPGAGCTLYKYNEQITWVGSYGEYDYYDDQGENYLTSCRANTASCSDDTTDDDTIGVLWYRATIGTINTPYDSVNEPPTQGSWYVGMLEAISFTIDTFSRDFGTLTPGGNPSDLTNTITVTTSATHGYVVYARAEQDMTCSNLDLCGTAEISDWPSGNDAPTTWNAGSYGFGYSTNDYDLQGGTANRFSGPNFAGFTELGFGDPVADRTGPSSSQANIITYRIAAGGVQTAGTYQTSIYYVVAPTY